jgi:hypothetical protein
MLPLNTSRLHCPKHFKKSENRQTSILSLRQANSKVRPIQNIDIQNKPLKQALEKLLEHQPLVFTIDNGIIVI